MLLQLASRLSELNSTSESVDTANHRQVLNVLAIKSFMPFLYMAQGFPYKMVVILIHKQYGSSKGSGNVRLVAYTHKLKQFKSFHTTKA